jgi:hypothetical protein
VGSVEDELGRADLGTVEDAILAEFEAGGHKLVAATPDSETLALAERLTDAHRPPG